MPGDYRIRFMGDLGNLAQFTSGIVSSASTIKGAFRNAAASPVTNLKVPGLSLGNLSTTVDSANKVLIQSGQVFTRVVSGWTRDLAKLDAATARSAASNARAGAGLNYRGSSFPTAAGPAVYGTSVNPKTGRAGVYAKDLRPTYETVASGEYRQIMGDVDKINAANKALIPMQKELAAIAKTSQLETLRNEAIRLTMLADQTEQLKIQNALRTKLNAAYAIGTGGRAPVYDRNGNIITPGILGKPTGTRSEMTSLLNTPTYQALATQKSVLKQVSPGVSSLNAQGQVVVTPPVTKLVPPTPAKMRAFIQKDINALKAGTTPPNADLQRALYESRGIEAIERDLVARNVLLAKIEADLAAQNIKQQAFNKRVAAKVRGVESKYVDETQALMTAQTTPRIPEQLDRELAKSKSLRNQIMKGMNITSPYGTADFAKQLNAKMESVSVTQDATRGIKQIRIDAKDAEGALMNLNTAVDRHGRVIQKMTGAYRNSGSMLGMIGQDFKKVLEWTVATTLVFGAFGVALGAFSKINQVNMDLQRFQIVTKATGDEVKAAFNGIAAIAYKTATPLTELTAIMDDVALATRKVGQTAAEWTSDILALTEAVGIFTNIAGVDTVKAADLLSAAYKQAQIAPEQLIILLNKVTAVAGGNAQAVQDIVSAIGTVSEAAKAAGLNMDQQIAAVQVLSQVTNKSAADIATSFKNLFGSINAPASIKILKSFGIDVRDETGSLRGFLDILKDVYDAMQSGAIPAGRVQDVLRGISGGPRRAPDMAAILGNLPKIFETVDKAVYATNEALVANAKILETNSAKLQQVRTAFDTTMVTQFSESINKLVEILVTLGKAFNSVLGGQGGAIANSVIQFAILAGGIGAVVKVGTSLRAVLWGLFGDLKVLNTVSKASGALFFGNATFDKKTGAYTSIIPLMKSERPGYSMYPSGSQGIDPVTGKNIPARFEYWPTKPGTTPEKPTALNVVPKALQPISTKFASSRGLRLGGAGVAGAALGLGLGAAGAATGSSAFSTIGTTVGMLGLMSMNPIGMAAGAATIAVSQLFQTWLDGIEKTKEKQKELQATIYDQIKALAENKRVLDSAKTERESNKKTMDTLNAKEKATSLTTDETESLTAAQQAYISSTMDVITAEKALADSRDRLLNSLPQLEKYSDLAKKAYTLNAEDLKWLSNKLVEDLLTESGSFTPTNTPYREAFKTPDVFHIAGRPVTTADTLAPSIYGRSDINAKETVSVDLLIERLRKEGAAGAIKFLRSPQSMTGTEGVEVTPALTSVLDTLLSFADEDTKATSEFKEAVEIFKTSVLTLPGASSPLQIMAQNLAAFQARTQANSTLGIITSGEAINAMGRQNIGAEILAKTKNLPETVAPAGRATRSGAGGARTSLTQKDINEYLFGKGGFVSEGAAPNLLAPSAEEAKQMFAILTDLSPELYDVQKGSKDFAEITYQYFKFWGIEVDGLHDPMIQLEEDLAMIREQIETSVKSGKQGLFNDLVSLQAAIQGGEYKGADRKVATAEQDQIYNLIDAYTKLGEAFTVNTGLLTPLKESLGSLRILQGLLLVENGDLLASFLGIARSMGMSGTAIETLVTYVKGLLIALSTINAYPDIIKNITIKIKTAIEGGNALDAYKSFMEAFNETNKNIAAQKKAAADLAAIEKLFANTKGSAAFATGTGSAAAKQVGLMDLPPEFKQDPNRTTTQLLQEAIKNAKALQHSIPGADKEYKGQMVAILDGTKKVMTTTNIGEEYLRRAMEELTEQIKKQNDLLTKADTIRRIRVGAGDFAALANVPINSKSGISVGGPQGPITISLNITGQVLTEAQIKQLGNSIAAGLGSAIGTN